MGILRILFLILAGVFLSLVLLFLAFLVWAAIDREDAFFTDGAVLAETGFYFSPRATPVDDFESREKELPVFAHRVSAGHGTVFGYRWFSNGSALAMDDESYEKVTIWFKKDVPLGNSKFDLSRSEDVVAIYTKGGSAWPREACFGSLASGEVALERSEGALDVRVSGEFTPSVRADGSWCKAFPLHAEYRAGQLEFGNLTPWLGLKADHPYDETYR